MSAPHNVVVLQRFLTRMEAELAQGALEAANIQASVSTEEAAGAPAGAPPFGVRLLVRQEDVHRAGDLIGLNGHPLA